jgi:hypothetical protein
MAVAGVAWAVYLSIETLNEGGKRSSLWYRGTTLQMCDARASTADYIHTKQPFGTYFTYHNVPRTLTEIHKPLWNHYRHLKNTNMVEVSK